MKAGTRDLVHYELAFFCVSERCGMSKRDHLRRLSREHYLGNAIVHWSVTTVERKQGWLSAKFLYRFRELRTHSMFRYGLACPIFCLMPDHIHMVWMGLLEESDQLNAMKHFRPNCDESLKRIGFQLQDQAYDHVLNEEERRETEFRNVCLYVARNPERAGLVESGGYAAYPFVGCIVPGYPDLRPFDSGYWAELDKIVSFLRNDGLMRVGDRKR